MRDEETVLGFVLFLKTSIENRTIPVISRKNIFFIAPL